MKNKKLLLILLAILAVVVVVVIILVSVFSVQDVELVYYKYDGTRLAKPEDGLSKDEVLQLVKGQSIVFLSKENALEKINAKFTDWHAFAIVKNFPNTLEIHLADRVTVAKIDIGGTAVYVDSFGYIMQTDSAPLLLDITSAFMVRDAVSVENGRKLQFTDEKGNIRLEQVLGAISAMWRANIEYNQMTSFFGERGVFEFDSDDSLVINTLQGAKIVVKSPLAIQSYSDREEFENRLISAFSVYANPEKNNQREGVVITVSPDGTISSKDK